MLHDDIVAVVQLAVLNTAEAYGLSWGGLNSAGASAGSWNLIPATSRTWDHTHPTNYMLPHTQLQLS